MPERPSWGAFTEVPEHGIAFYLNGLVTNMSSATDYSSDVPTTELEGMVVLDLQNHTVLHVPINLNAGLTDADTILCV